MTIKYTKIDICKTKEDQKYLCKRANSTNLFSLSLHLSIGAGMVWARNPTEWVDTNLCLFSAFVQSVTGLRCDIADTENKKKACLYCRRAYKTQLLLFLW